MSSTKLFCATVLYPFKEGAYFDYGQYTSMLIPEYVALLGDNCVRHEVRKGITAPGRAHVDFICMANFWVMSPERFGAAMATPEMKALMDKIAAFTDIVPIRQFDVVLG